MPTICRSSSENGRSSSNERRKEARLRRVLVVPSLWYENTPLVLYSAQAAHCPVIASNLPGLTEVIQENENGLLFEPGVYSSLASQLTRLLNEEGLLIGLQSRSRAPKTISKYVDELMSLWLLSV